MGGDLLGLLSTLIDISNCRLDLPRVIISVSITSLLMIKYPNGLPIENPSVFSRSWGVQQLLK